MIKIFTTGAADFNQFLRLRNQQIIAAINIDRQENVSPVLIPTMSEDMDGQLEMAHKLVDELNRANRKICVTAVQLEIPEKFYAQFRLFARKKVDEKFQQIVFVTYKLEEFIYLRDVKNSVYDKKLLLINPFVMSCKIFFHLFTLYHSLFYSSQEELEHWR